MLRILYICNEYSPAPHGGIGIYTKFLAEELAQKGYEIAVAGYDPTIGKPIERQVNNVTVFRYPLPQKEEGGVGRAISFFRERMVLSRHIAALCATFNPDIVESYDWSGPLWHKPRSGHFVVRMHGAHTVYNRWMGVSRKRAKLMRYTEKKNLLFADSLVAVSELIQEKTAKTFGLSSKHTAVIYNGVDVKRFVPTKGNGRDSNRLLFVGRVHQHKGLDLLLRALEIVFRERENVYLEVIGPIDSIYAENLMNSIPRDLLTRINFKGSVPNEQLPEVYSSAFLCFQPSRVEALGITCLEAMACGTPVVMSSLVAATEIIDDGIDGFIVDPRNPELFAKCILNALKSDSAIESMRIKCREKITERFSLDKIVLDNEHFYEGCLR